VAKKRAKRADFPEDAILLVRNKKALHDYEISERLEAGLVLLGSEVKSLRDKRASLDEAYVVVRGKEAWLTAARINEYPWANQFNHEPDRRRKLLLHRREIEKLATMTDQRGYSAIPLALYLLRGRVKLQVGIGRGRRHYEKRQVKKEADAQREIDRALRR
jgi:SsrA-binding protein